MDERSKIRRPPSYSDSFLFLPESQMPLILTKNSSVGSFFIEPAELLLQTPAVTTVATVATVATVTTVATVANTTSNNPYTVAEKWFSRLLGFGVHITLISLFETIFFFQYISKSEDAGIQNTLDDYINGILTTCQDWPNNTTLLLNDILSVLVNTTQVADQAIVAAQQRYQFNRALEIQAWLYVTGLAITVIIAACLGRQARLRLAWKRIVVENLIMVTLLGLYELTFFKTIIYNYDNLSVAELDEKVVTQLQQTCQLLV